MRWAILIIVALGTTFYLVSFSRIVAQELDAIAGTDSRYSLQGSQSNNEGVKKSMETAIFKTNFGTIEVEFFPAEAPATMENFLKLARAGFYDGTRFHRVIEGFMIQGGDPFTRDPSNASAWGTGGPGYRFADEIDPGKPLYREGYRRGILAMANAGPDTNGSQFFIMHKDYPLPPKYTIFGRVVTGIEIVDKIAGNPTARGDRPIKEVILENVTVR